MLLGWNLLTMYCRILRFYHQNGLFKEICCISCSLCQGRHARVMFCRKLDGGNCWHYMLAPSLRSFGKSGLQGASFSLGPKRWPKLGTKDSVLRCQESQIHIYIYNDAFKTSAATGLRSWQVTANTFVHIHILSRVFYCRQLQPSRHVPLLRLPNEIFLVMWIPKDNDTAADQA